MTGKGSAPRPFDIDRQTFESNWDRIFNHDRKRSAGNSGQVQDVEVKQSQSGTTEGDQRSVQDSSES